MTQAIRLSFLGAAGTVTGSRYLLNSDNGKTLIDCGLFQGLKQLRLKNWAAFPIDPKSIDAVLLTHAHIDHSGYLPILVKNGYNGKIFATHGTTALCKILLPDCAYLHEEEARHMNKHDLSKHHPALPLFDAEDAYQALSQMSSVDWNVSFEPVSGIKASFQPVSHLLGASALTVTVGGNRILFSGDVGRDQDPFLPPKSTLNEADYVVVESTYGDRLHALNDPLDELADVINRTNQRGGITMIPTFAVGRAQNLIYYIDQLKKQNRIPNIPVFLNSPMAIEASETYCAANSEFRMNEKDMREIFRGVKFVNTPQESYELNNKQAPAIILSASGMMTGGRILHLLQARADDPRNTILIAGFQAAGTRGEALARGKRELKIFGQSIPVRAEVYQAENLSGHADYQEIIDWLKTLKNKPKACFVTHGEPVAADEMRQHIEQQLGWTVHVPDLFEEVVLN